MSISVARVVVKRVDTGKPEAEYRVTAKVETDDSEPLYLTKTMPMSDGLFSANLDYILDEIGTRLKSLHEEVRKRNPTPSRQSLKFTATCPNCGLEIDDKVVHKIECPVCNVIMEFA